MDSRTRILLSVVIALLVATAGCTSGNIISDDDSSSYESNSSQEENGVDDNEETYTLVVNVDSEDDEEVPAHISVWENGERIGEEQYGTSAEFEGLKNGTYEVHILTDDDEWSDERIEVAIDGEDETVDFETERTENGSSTV